MLRSTLVAQILTFLLDSQGADAAALKEVFPEEFIPRVHGTPRAHRSGVPWQNASEDLEDSLCFLVERHLVAFTAEGRVVAEAHHERDTKFSADERDEAFGVERTIEWDFVPGLPLEHCDPFDFECPRYD